MSLNMPIKLSPLEFHVHGASVADGTFVGGLHVGVVALAVDVVATSHGDDGGGGGEHPVSADRTVAFGGTLYTSVCCNPGD